MRYMVRGRRHPPGEAVMSNWDDESTIRYDYTDENDVTL